MNIFFNKQREMLLALPLAGILFVVGGYVLWNFLMQERIQYATAQEQEAQARVRLWKPVTPKEELPIAMLIPLRNDDAEDLTLPDAHAAVIIDVASQNVLYHKNATQHRAIASTTKLLTAIIVIDRIQDLSTYVRVPEKGVPIEGTRIGCLTSTVCQGNRLVPGEELMVRDLLAAMLMDSANDAATLLALHISGSEEAFATLMNLRAKELGLHDSNFCRPSGLEVDPPRKEEECYSSAYDIARVMAQIVREDRYRPLRDIMQTKEQTITSKDGTITHALKNTNRIIDDVPYLLGVKTGFTPRAGFSLVAAAQKPHTTHRVVAVVLDDHSRFADIEKMFTWVFENYTWS